MKKDEIKFNKETFITHSKGRLTSKYKILNELGNGSFGKVIRVENLINKEIYACKKMIKKNIKDIKSFNNEIDILSKCDHPNIIRLYEIIEGEKNVNLIMEECKGGQLFKKIQLKNIIKMTEKEIAKIFKEIMIAVNYLHNRGICHRDLKPENILFLNNEENSPIKLVDFGLGKIFGDYGKLYNNEMKNTVGTIYYMSPEVLKGKYDQFCDIWSCGVILYLMLSGKLPFNGKNDDEIFDKILEMKVEFPEKEWKNIDKDAIDLIKKMLCNVSDRLNAQQVLNHVWVQKNAPNPEGFIEKVNKKTIKNYSSFNKIKKSVINFISSRLNDDEIEKLKNIFYEMDINKDGTITLDEMQECLSKMFKNNKNYIENLFNEIDTNKSGRIEYTQLISALIEQQTYLKDEKLKEAFDNLDKDKNGKISNDEFVEFLKLQKKDEKVIENYVKQFDLNGDGEIDYDEFINMMMNSEIKN
jgi:calcium-dependent protein kinase